MVGDYPLLGGCVGFLVYRIEPTPVAHYESDHGMSDFNIEPELLIDRRFMSRGLGSQPKRHGDAKGSPAAQYEVNLRLFVNEGHREIERTEPLAQQVFGCAAAFRLNT